MDNEIEVTCAENYILKPAGFRTGLGIELPFWGISGGCGRLGLDRRGGRAAAQNKQKFHHHITRKMKRVKGRIKVFGYVTNGG